MKSSLLNQFRGVLLGRAIADWRSACDRSAVAALASSSLPAVPKRQPFLNLAVVGVADFKGNNWAGWAGNGAELNGCPITTALFYLPTFLLFYQDAAKTQHLSHYLTLTAEQPPPENTLITCWLVSAILDLALQGQLSSAAALHPLFHLSPPDMMALPVAASTWQQDWEPSWHCLVEAYDSPQGLTLFQRQLQSFCRPQLQPFWLALYGLLSMPDDYSLAIERSLKAIAQPALTTALLGAWLGGKLGLSGIPLCWQRDFQLSTQAASQGASYSASSVEQFADNLFAYWCGISTSSINSEGQMPAIATL
ncbi:MAG: hypothetical protein ACTS3T_22040 [Almyronema sp.]